MPSAPHRVALLGGSFDPVHLGHLAMAQAALNQLPIDELWWVPVGQAWQKSRTLTPADHRVAMLQLAMGRDARQRIEPCEIERAGPTYTINTLNTLKTRYPGTIWTLLLGWDQLLNLPTWKRWRDVVAQVQLAVAPRPRTPQALGVAGPQSAVAGLPTELQALPIEVLHMAPWDASSTAVRADVAQGRGILDRVSAPVARYIADHGLYRAA